MIHKPKKRANTESVVKAVVLVFGFGINDEKSPTCYVEDGKTKAHKWYACWKEMLRRCYCPKFQQRQPTYRGCKVSDEWLLASKFKIWFDDHYREGCQLDKDLLVPGNKTYGPLTCVFVTPQINSLLLYSSVSQGECPIGVRKVGNTFRAVILTNSIKKYLGAFKTAEQAHWKYAHAKIDYVRGVCVGLPARLDEGIESKLWSIFPHIFAGEDAYEDRPWNI